MTYRFKTEELARSAAHHLRVAAERYTEHANSGVLPRISEQFKRQADEANQLADEITEQVG